MFKSVGLCAVGIASMSLLIGCGNEPPQPAQVEEVKPKLEQAFKESNGEVQTLANEAIAAINTSDHVKAYLQLETLAGKEGLTPEQKAAAAKTMASVNARLLQAAAEGNQQAAQFLQMRRAGK
ncbi:MAG: hypothetical protein AB1813_09680 [Verrucomicrobiota bacterium]|jgi:hypothetical protein